MSRQLTTDAIDRAVEDGLVDEGAVRFDGLDSAVIGTGRQWGSPSVLVYSARLIVEELERTFAEEDDPEEAALEWFGHNVECLYAGPGTPVIVHDLDAEAVE